MLYTKKSSVIDAIQWTGENYEEIKEMNKKYDYIFIQLATLIRPDDYEAKEWLITIEYGEITFVNIGDYIFINKSGNLEVVEAEEFESAYIQMGGNDNERRK